MEQKDVPQADPRIPRVLAAGSTDGHRVELLEYHDGSCVITRDGAEQAIYRPGATSMESCIHTYLRLLRSYPGISVESK